MISIFKTFVAMMILAAMTATSSSAQSPYITTWNTASLASLNHSDSNQITFPAQGNFQYIWEEVSNPGNSGSGTGSGITVITFPHPGIYRLSVTPAANNPFTQLEGMGNTDEDKLLTVEQWGNISWSSLESTFNGAVLVRFHDSHLPDLSNVTSMAYTFTGTSFDTIPNLDSWDVSHVKDMSYLFGASSQFNQDIGDWNVSQVTNMSGMFYGAADFNQPIENWNVGNVTDMSYMFSNGWVPPQPYAFNQPIGNWNVSNVTTMAHMFDQSHSFNQPVGNWDVSNVKYMENIFNKATNFNQSLANWDLRSLIHSGIHNDISLAYCGMSCENYSLTLHGWANNPHTPSDIVLDASELSYSSNVATDRNYLIKNLGWTIKGDTLGDCTLSISETKANVIKIFPNPVQNFISVSGLKGKETIKLIDITGRALKTVILKDQTSVRIGVSHLAAGVYNLIIIAQNGQTISKKFLKH